jgi:hypothetical protein
MSVITLFIPVNQIIKNIVRFNKFNNINVFFFFSNYSKYFKSNCQTNYIIYWFSMFIS